jgi:hypothetical protein
LTGDAPATIAWIAPAPPDEAQAAALSSWARERGVALVEPSRQAPETLTIDDHAADEIEALLVAAREAIVAHERTAADRALDAAEARLRAHAELPQAAWLMAEVERARSMRWRRTQPVDSEAAERSSARADALDGGRVAGVGEQVAIAATPAARVLVDVPPGDEIWIDGASATTRPTPVRAGLHAVRVTWRGRTVWATWIDVPGGDSTVTTDAPGTIPCSTADLASARLVIDGASAATAGTATRAVEGQAVRCPQWVAAAPGNAADTVSVALCTVGRCGPLLDWHRPVVALFAVGTVQPADHATRWPAWATWTLVGAGAAIAAGAAIVASGALKGPPSETVFVNGGLKTP